MRSSTRRASIVTRLVLLLAGKSNAFLQSYYHCVIPVLRQHDIQLRHVSSPSTSSSALFSTNPSIGSGAQCEIPFWRARQDCWRPDVRDVEKISWGMPAKKKGTGSRGTPHRLNEEERRAFDQARRQGFLQVKGSSWRSQRRDAPLINSYRSLMDARGRPAIVLHKLNPSSGSSDGEDILVIDLSPLRYPDEFESVAQKVKEVVAEQLQIKASEDIRELSSEDENETNEDLQADFDSTMYETRPIYQLPAFLVHFKTTRQQGKEIGRMLAGIFETVEEKASKDSTKPNGVKPGKSRQHGGYGIG